MQLSYPTYADKVRACFIGKNIGGTLGAPFEGKRGTTFSLPIPTPSD